MRFIQSFCWQSASLYNVYQQSTLFDDRDDILLTTINKSRLKYGRFETWSFSMI